MDGAFAALLKGFGMSLKLQINFMVDKHLKYKANHVLPDTGSHRLIDVGLVYRVVNVAKFET